MTNNSKTTYTINFDADDTAGFRAKRGNEHFMHGFLRQLMIMSLNGREPNETVGQVVEYRACDGELLASVQYGVTHPEIQAEVDQMDGDY